MTKEMADAAIHPTTREDLKRCEERLWRRRARLLRWIIVIAVVEGLWFLFCLLPLRHRLEPPKLFGRFVPECYAPVYRLSDPPVDRRMRWECKDLETFVAKPSFDTTEKGNKVTYEKYVELRVETGLWDTEEEAIKLIEKVELFQKNQGAQPKTTEEGKEAEQEQPVKEGKGLLKPGEEDVERKLLDSEVVEVTDWIKRVDKYKAQVHLAYIVLIVCACCYVGVPFLLALCGILARSHCCLKFYITLVLLVLVARLGSWGLTLAKIPGDPWQLMRFSHIFHIFAVIISLKLVVEACKFKSASKQLNKAKTEFREQAALIDVREAERKEALEATLAAKEKLEDQMERDKEDESVEQAKAAVKRANKEMEGVEMAKAATEAKLKVWGEKGHQVHADLQESINATDDAIATLNARNREIKKKYAERSRMHGIMGDGMSD